MRNWPSQFGIFYSTIVLHLIRIYVVQRVLKDSDETRAVGDCHYIADCWLDLCGLGGLHWPESHNDGEGAQSEEGLLDMCEW